MGEQALSVTGPDAPRIAFLSFSSGQYDARTLRMAQTAVAAGYRVTVYARWYPGLPVTEERDGFRIIRAPVHWRLAVPGLRRAARARVAASMRAAAAAADRPTGDVVTVAPPPTPPLPARAVRRVRRVVRRVVRRALFRISRRWRLILLNFPLKPLAWAAALEAVAEPADIWHGMWAGSLPALARMRGRHGGRTIYDSRDIYMEARSQAHAGAPGKQLLAGLERRWARAADAVLTVNDAYADAIEERLGVRRPVVVMNVPARWEPLDPPPDRIREALGLDPGTRVVLYQGGLMSDRGIEQCMDAILRVPGAVLCLLGFGALQEELAAASTAPPYAGRVFLLDPVPPAELVEWTASADVSVMMIQPTSLNHRLTTPQKLFESIAAGVPVVASDLPGMAPIVREDGIGVVCDPQSPAAIASAICSLLEEPADAHAERRARILRVAHDRYNWEVEEPVLLDFYRRLLAGTRARRRSPRAG